MSRRGAGVGRAARWLGWLLAGLAAPSASVAAPIVPGSPTTSWTTIDYPTLTPDFADDQQTGITEADIVGDASNPAFYTTFDDAGTPGLQDGAIGFRVRVGADKPPPGFEHFMGVGLDSIGIFDAGTGLNVSPSTTSITSMPLTSYVPDAANYDFSAVTATNDPSATSFDLDLDGNTDFFVSFVLPFGDIVTALAAQGIPGVNENTAMRYVVGSSTQPNALNQDLGGPDGGTTSALTWEALGAISVTMTPTGVTVIPEPSSLPLVAAGLLALAAARLRGRLPRPEAQSPR
jgi:hypothetical protein